MTKAASERDAASVMQEWNPSTSVTLEAENAPRRSLTEFLKLHPDSPEALAIASMRRTITRKNPKVKSLGSTRTPGSIDYIEGMKRRLGASLRLPPLECGCRDAETVLHRDSCLGGH